MLRNNLFRAISVRAPKFPNFDDEPPRLNSGFVFFTGVCWGMMMMVIRDRIQEYKRLDEIRKEMDHDEMMRRIIAPGVDEDS
jgi:hypothetical protein